MNPAAIDLAGIVKHYHMGAEDIPALKGIDLQVRRAAARARC